MLSKDLIASGQKTFWPTRRKERDFHTPRASVSASHLLHVNRVGSQRSGEGEKHTIDISNALSVTFLSSLLRNRPTAPSRVESNACKFTAFTCSLLPCPAPECVVSVFLKDYYSVTRSRSQAGFARSSLMVKTIVFPADMLTASANWEYDTANCLVSPESRPRRRFLRSNPTTFGIPMTLGRSSFCPGLLLSSLAKMLSSNVNITINRKGAEGWVQVKSGQVNK